MSFEHIRQTEARLQALLSLFDWEGILLQDRYKDDNDSETDLEDDVVTLGSYDLVGIGVAADV